MKRLSTLLWFSLAPAAWAFIPVSVVVPAGLGNVEGNTNVNDFVNSSSFRMQLVFDASQFGGLGSGPAISNSVYGIAFRIDGPSTFDAHWVFGGGSVTLSTTTRTPDGLSSVFAENVGGDAVTIYSGALSFGGAFHAGASPQPFGDTIPALRPFYYDPARGNLLVDIAASGGQVLFPGALDAQSSNGDAISRVFSSNGNSPTGTPDTLGLVTRFNIAVIPEPGTLLLFLTGLTLLFMVKNR
jgi:hypothetical protein